MAFFYTSKLPKRQLYGNNLSLINKPPSPAITSVSGKPTRTPETASGSGGWMDKRRQSSLSGYESDEDFVQHINQIKIDCVGFLPDELQVRLTSGRRLEVQGEHLEFHSQRLAIKRQLHRCYPLPDGVDVQNILCKFTKSGTLKIQIPFKDVARKVPREPLLLETRLTSRTETRTTAGRRPDDDNRLKKGQEMTQSRDASVLEANFRSQEGQHSPPPPPQQEKKNLSEMQMKSRDTLMKLKMCLKRDDDQPKRGLM